VALLRRVSESINLVTLFRVAAILHLSARNRTKDPTYWDIFFFYHSPPRPLFFPARLHQSALHSTVIARRLRKVRQVKQKL